MGKIKQWIVSNKVWSIVIASVLVVAIALAIALPLALSHRHTWTWSHDTVYHWHACTGKKCDEITDKAEHTYGEWTVSTPAGYGVDIVKEHSCTVCGYKQEQTVENTKLESHNTLVMRNTAFNNMATGAYTGKLLISAIIINGSLSVGDKLVVDGYDGELTVLGIVTASAPNTELNTVDYNTTEEIRILCEESVSKDLFTTNAYITKSGAPVQRYTKFTLSVTTTSERTSSISNNLRSKLIIGGKTVTVVVSDIVNTVDGSDVDGILGNGGTGTMTVTIVDENVSVVAWAGMEIVGKDDSKIIFNGTVTGVLTA